jgi:hypothetical protein
MPAVRDDNSVFYPELVLMEPNCDALMLLDLWKQHLQQVVSVGQPAEVEERVQAELTVLTNTISTTHLAN